MNKYFFLFFTVIIFNGYSEGRMETYTETGNGTIETAGNILLDAFYSDNYVIKREAIYGLRYLDNKNIFSNILTLFNSYIPDYPGFDLIKDTALGTLYYLDPDRTIQWLKEYNTFLEQYNNSVLYVFEPALLFETIGTENYFYFDNINYYLDSNTDKITSIKILTEQYLNTGEKKYLLAVYDSFSFFDVFQYEALFNFFGSRKISPDIVYFNVNERIPYLRTGSSLEYTGTPELNHLLLEALLFRMGFKEEVYTKSFYIDNPVMLYKNHDIDRISKYYSGRRDSDITDLMEAEMPELTQTEKEIAEELYSGSAGGEDTFSVANKKTVYNTDLGLEGNSPYYLLCDSAAYCFAGIPEERHLEAFINNFDELETSIQLRFAEIIAFSPSNDIQNRILKFLSCNTNKDVRTISYSTYREQGSFPDYLKFLLYAEDETVYNRSILIRAAGNEQDIDNSSLISPLLNNEDNLISVTAAGEILHLNNKN